ncbi:hypothetical protein IAT38_005876 [Cryptococcus sp. DSM 104549]
MENNAPNTTTNTPQKQPASGPVRPTRTRNGCLVCRSRRLKCDLEKPECRRCVNYGAECVYPAKKPFDPEAVAEKLRRRHKGGSVGGTASPGPASVSLPQLTGAGAAQLDHPTHASSQHTPTTGSSGLAGPTPDSSTTAFPPISLPGPLFLGDQGSMRSSTMGGGTVRQMDPMELLMALGRDTRMGQFFSGPVAPPDFLKAAFPIEAELRCFHHCFTYTLSIMVVREEYNMFVEHVIPLFLFPSGEAPLSIAALRYATLTVGAVHLASLESKGSAPNTDGHSRELSMQYRWEANKLLRAASRDPAELATDSFLAACAMLSIADMLGAMTHWREVLRLTYSALRHRGGCERILFGNGGNPSPLTVCLVEHAAIMDLSGTLNTGDDLVVPDENSGWWERLYRINPAIPDTVEISSGCHRGVVRLAFRIANLLFEARHRTYYTSPLPLSAMPTGRPDLPQRIATAFADLQAWRENVYPTISEKRVRDGSLGYWYGLNVLVRRDLLMQHRTTHEIQECATATMDICSQVGPKVEYMNWPMIMACSVLEHPEERQRAREIFNSFIYQASFEIDMAQTVVEECWRRMDEGLDDEGCSWREILIETRRPVLLG